VLVRSWNLFHGRTHPPGPRIHLRAMIDLATSDDPDAVCLQELPLWSLRHLAGWSRMSVFAATAKRALVPGALGGVLHRRWPRLIRSGITGQANAILLAPRHEVFAHRSVRVSERGRERRVCHAVRLDGLVLGNVHASNEFQNPEVPRAELRRAHDLLDWVAGEWSESDARILAGDFNLRDPALPGPNIDHIVAAGIEHGPLEVWPDERRVQNGALLSDHAPVEVRLG
jgi:endonuclease/exonuclease/phosphatase family metal-dependent hydrolase